MPYPLQGPIRPLETEETPLGSRAVKSFAMTQGEANPSLVFSREEVETLLLRKWKKLRKELVVDDGKSQAEPHDDLQQHHQQQQQHTRLRAVIKNPLFDYRSSVATRAH